MLITENIHVETGTGEPSRICASNLRRITAADYNALGEPADDTLYIIVPEEGAEDLPIEGIYQGGNMIYRKGFSNFDLVYALLRGEDFAASDSEGFVTSDGRDFLSISAQ